MGWADCGTDSEGRPIGYAFPATCDHPGCDTKIDRGLSYACGNMHGNTNFGCEGYFCTEHLMMVDKDHDSQLCPECCKLMEEAKAEEARISDKPSWCPHPDCQHLRTNQDACCGGRLPEPAPHDDGMNTHRFCLRGAADDGGVFDLQVHTGDLFWFDLAFDAIREDDGKPEATSEWKNARIIALEAKLNTYKKAFSNLTINTTALWKDVPLEGKFQEWYDKMTDLAIASCLQPESEDVPS